MGKFPVLREGRSGRGEGERGVERCPDSQGKGDTRKSIEAYLKTAASPKQMPNRGRETSLQGRERRQQRGEVTSGEACWGDETRGQPQNLDVSRPVKRRFSQTGKTPRTTKKGEGERGSQSSTTNRNLERVEM